MRYYPISIDTKNKKVLVIGGGRAALIKISSIVRSEADVSMVSNQICDEIFEFKDKISIINDNVTLENVENYSKYDIVFICTNNAYLNLQLLSFYKSRGTLSMSTGDVENSDFIMSSIIEKENIVVSINTQGSSPTATKLLKAEINELLDDGLVKKINILSDIRRILLESKCSVDKDINIKESMDNLVDYDVDYLLEYKIKLESRRKQE